MKSAECKVYGLSSSRHKEIRYIGQTTQPLNKRLSQHLNYAKCRKTAVHKWMFRELNDGFKIVIFLLHDGAVFNVTEIDVIAQYKSNGARLLNLTEGGEGTVGWRGNMGKKRPDLSARNRLGKGKPGHPSTPETNAKISVANKGRKNPWLSERNRSMLGKPGHPHTQESRAKISAALKGRVCYWGSKISEAKRAAA